MSSSFGFEARTDTSQLAQVKAANDSSKLIRSEVSADEYISCMRRYPGAVNIITTADGDAWAGLTATAVCSLSAEPARILCCVNQRGVTLNVIRNTEVFCINLLSLDHKELAMRFAGMSDIGGEDRFSEGIWKPMTTGAPSLLNGLMALDCELESIVEFESHSILIGRVVETKLFKGSQPLIWFDGGFAEVTNKASRKVGE